MSKSESPSPEEGEEQEFVLMWMPASRHLCLLTSCQNGLSACAKKLKCKPSPIMNYRMIIPKCRRYSSVHKWLRNWNMFYSGFKLTFSHEWNRRNLSSLSWGGLRSHSAELDISASISLSSRILFRLSSRRKMLSLIRKFKKFRYTPFSSSFAICAINRKTKKISKRLRCVKETIQCFAVEIYDNLMSQDHWSRNHLTCLHALRWLGTFHRYSRSPAILWRILNLS